MVNPSRPAFSPKAGFRVLDLRLTSRLLVAFFTGGAGPHNEWPELEERGRPAVGALPVVELGNDALRDAGHGRQVVLPDTRVDQTPEPQKKILNIHASGIFLSERKVKQKVG